jgi:hypothetical protein
MDEHIEQLVLRLMARGMGLRTIPNFIRDVARVVIESRYVTCALVNSKLAERGWPAEHLDERSLQLIVELLEESEVLRVQRVLLH